VLQERGPLSPVEAVFAGQIAIGPGGLDQDRGEGLFARDAGLFHERCILAGFEIFVVEERAATPLSEGRLLHRLPRARLHATILKMKRRHCPPALARGLAMKRKRLQS
jgi:hypothetical protein